MKILLFFFILGAAEAAEPCQNPAPVVIERAPVGQCTYKDVNNLFEAIEKNCVNLVDEQLRREPVLVGTKLSGGYELNPLGYAVYLGRLEIIDLMLKAGKVENIQGAVKEGAADLVSLAILKKDFDALKLLASLILEDNIHPYAELSGDQVGAFSDLLLVSGYNDFPLQELVQQNACASLARVLPKLAGNTVQIQDLAAIVVRSGNGAMIDLLHKENDLPLSFDTLSEIKSLPIFQLLASYGANFTIRQANGDNRTLFFQLNPSLWPILEQYGADFNALDRFGNNAISEMLKYQRRDFDPIGPAFDLKLNLTQTYSSVATDDSCSQGNRKVNLLYLAAKSPVVTESHLDLLLAAGLSAEDTFSECPQVFHVAASGNHFKFMLELISLGVDVRNSNNARDFLRNTMEFDATLANEQDLLSVIDAATARGYRLENSQGYFQNLLQGIDRKYFFNVPDLESKGDLEFLRKLVDRGFSLACAENSLGQMVTNEALKEKLEDMGMTKCDH